MASRAHLRFDPRKLFSPKQAIRSEKAELFAGRAQIISDFLDAIAVEGASACIYGDAGVGKTSFAWQALEILSGNVRLLQEFSARPRLPVDVHRCIWLECIPGLVDVEDVLLALLTDQNSERTFHSEFPKVMHDSEIRDQVKRTYEFNLGLAKVKLDISGKTLPSPEISSSDLLERRQRVHSLFRQVLQMARAQANGSEIVIFIDEFNKIENKTGVGHLIKVTADCRFVLVGIADDVTDIIDDEASAGRKLEGSKFPLPRLDESEISDLLRRAERTYPGLLQFSDQYRKRISTDSEGYPWLVQLLGYNSVLRYAGELDRETLIDIDEVDLDRATEILAGPQGDVDRFQKLLRAVADQQNEESILFTLAEQPQGWVFKTFLKDRIPKKARLHFDTRVRGLTSAGVIKSDRGGRVRFTDPVYRAIVRFAARRQGGLRSPRN